MLPSNFENFKRYRVCNHILKDKQLLEYIKNLDPADFKRNRLMMGRAWIKTKKLKREDIYKGFGITDDFLVEVFAIACCSKSYVKQKSLTFFLLELILMS